MSNFTKGPWLRKGMQITTNGSRIPLATVKTGPGIVDPDANARLMAAAPDMFAALDRLARLGNGFEYGNSEGNLIAQAAMLKALTGGGE